MLVLRVRTCPMLSSAAYKTAIENWIGSMERVSSLDLALGPLISCPRRVSGDLLMRNKDLLEALIDAGAKEGVLHGGRLEGAFKSVIASKPSLAGCLGSHAPHLLSNHLVALCTCVRDFVRESQKSWPHGKAFPKYR